MKKPQRNRIPLRPDQKSEGEERAYTSNYGDQKSERPARKPRPDGDGGEVRKPYARKEGGEGARPFKERKPYGDRPFEKREGGFKKPYAKKEGEESRPFKERKPYGDKPFVKREGAGEDRPFKDRKPYGDKPFAKREDGERRPFQKREDGERKPYEKREGEARKPYNADAPRGERKPFEKRESGERKPFVRREDGERKSYNADAPRGERKPFVKREDGERKPFEKREGGERRPYGQRESKPFEKREGEERKPFAKREDGERKPFVRRENGENGGASFPPKRSYNKPEGEGKSYDKKPFRSGEKSDRKTTYGSDRPRRDSSETSGAKPRRRTFREGDEKPASEGEGMTLNKYLAHAGICGRREAGEIVKSGKVTLNGEVLLTPGYRVQPGDVVRYEDRVVKPEVAKVYVLLNKPKGFITTTEDEAERHTVMELVQTVEAERLYPVGRLDRNTTGVLLLTNDGDLAQRLTHPKYECKKIYQVTVDKDVTKADLEALATGITLEDGEIKADEVAYLETKSEIGIEIHSGRNRIVRRMFEHLGYTVEKLDRVMFAGLTKKNVPRGKYRLLTEKEVILLKHFKG